MGPNPGEHCPACGARMAPDQRYCLSCGGRRGDPRLPFMDAVVFMEAINQPRTASGPPAPARQSRSWISPNASLIAGVATLVLAIGVGVLIGRSGDESQPTAAATPQVITVEGGGGGAEASSDAAKKNTASGGNKKKGDAKSSSVHEQAADDVVKTAPGVDLASPETQVGDKCDPSEAGCGDTGKFEGTFFGE